MKYLRPILILILTLGLTNVAAAGGPKASAGGVYAVPNEPRAATYLQPHGACSGPRSVILRTTDPIIRDRRVAWLERCAEARWPTPGGLPMLSCIIQRESGGSPFALNPSGSAGLLQIIPSTWRSWWSAFSVRVRMQHLRDNPFSARSNLLLGVWAMNAYGLSPWGGGC